MDAISCSNNRSLERTEACVSYLQSTGSRRAGSLRQAPSNLWSCVQAGPGYLSTQGLRRTARPL